MNTLFFDTETVGLPRSWKQPAKFFPRMVQLAFIQTNSEGKPFKTMNAIIRPDGFEIPKEASDIHGITTDHALLHGRELKDVMTEFGKAWRDSGLIVAHNFEFDAKILDGEAWRLWGKYFVREKPNYCTMLTTTDLCKLPGHYGFKFPKLSELHQYLFGEGFEGAHDAMNDIAATVKCFYELKKRNLFLENLITKPKFNYE